MVKDNSRHCPMCKMLHKFDQQRLKKTILALKTHVQSKLSSEGLKKGNYFQSLLRNNTNSMHEHKNALQRYPPMTQEDHSLIRRTKKGQLLPIPIKKQNKFIARSSK